MFSILVISSLFNILDFLYYTLHAYLTFSIGFLQIKFLMLGFFYISTKHYKLSFLQWLFILMAKLIDPMTTFYLFWVGFFSITYLYFFITIFFQDFYFFNKQKAFSLFPILNYSQFYYFDFKQCLSIFIIKFFAHLSSIKEYLNKIKIDQMHL